jgi:fructose-1,6-bisphosphatase II / sedoheptulose-1,7-bisphosphatase
VTNDPLLAGIKREPGWVTLETILMRSKSGSIRRMTYKSPVR